MIRGVSEKYQKIISWLLRHDYDVITVITGNILETLRHANAKFGEVVSINKIFVFDGIIFYEVTYDVTMTSKFRFLLFA